MGHLHSLSLSAYSHTLGGLSYRPHTLRTHCTLTLYFSRICAFVDSLSLTPARIHALYTMGLHTYRNTYILLPFSRFVEGTLHLLYTLHADVHLLHTASLNVSLLLPLYALVCARTGFCDTADFTALPYTRLPAAAFSPHRHISLVDIVLIWTCLAPWTELTSLYHCRTTTCCLYCTFSARTPLSRFVTHISFSLCTDYTPGTLRYLHWFHFSHTRLLTACPGTHAPRPFHLHYHRSSAPRYTPSLIYHIFSPHIYYMHYGLPPFLYNAPLGLSFYIFPYPPCRLHVCTHFYARTFHLSKTVSRSALTHLGSLSTLSGF